MSTGYSSDCDVMFISGHISDAYDDCPTARHLTFLFYLYPLNKLN